MAYEISADTGETVITVKTKGDLEAEEFHKMITETEVFCREKSIRKVLVDHTSSTVQHISAEEIHGVAMLCSILNDAMEGGKLAVVLIHDIDYGLGRMWHSYAINNLNFDSELFRNRQEAEAWLEESTQSN